MNLLKQYKGTREDTSSKIKVT